MKKNLFFVVALTFLSASAFSQGISFGVKAGLSISNEKVSSNGISVSPSSLVGFHGGAYLTAMLSDHIGVQPELLYSGQGYKSGSTSVHVNYITIPVLFRYNVNDLISFHAGPQIGFLASAKAKDGSNSTDVKDAYKSSDFGVAFGGTVDLPMGLNFTLRYGLGLSNVNKDSDPTVKNGTFQISAGYRLFGGK